MVARNADFAALAALAASRALRSRRFSSFSRRSERFTSSIDWVMTTQRTGPSPSNRAATSRNHSPFRA